MFSFFYFKNIRFDILKRSVLNLSIEKDARRAQGQENHQQPLTWYQRYRDLRLSILAFAMKGRGPPALPLCLRETSVADFDESRVRYALRELTRISLITHDDVNDSYSIHPFVHRRARERPGMSTAEQAVWAHVAAVVLARSILLPPLGLSGSYRSDNPGKPNTSLHRACSVWTLEGRGKATVGCERLYAPRLGPGSSFNAADNAGIAQTYWNQGRGDEAAELQQAVLQACITSLGPNAHETLMAKDLLGQTRWQEGRYTHARTLQQEAVDGLIKLKGIDNDDTLMAMGNLGRTKAKFYENLEEAKSLLKRASDGMSKVLGPTHTKTLVVQEDLALLAVQMEEELSEPLEMVQQVLDTRREKLGKEHPYTLLALASLARITNALGQHTKAENILRSGLSIAERNLGDSHIGTLMWKVLLGTILTNQSRFAEAESTLLDVMEKQRHIFSYRGGLSSRPVECDD
ncbi:hypothetical protein BDW67DRAFT_187715 [Aspergillus spinulosporus]